MKLYLEKSDLLEIIGKYFGDSALDPDQFEVRTDPFMVIISGVDVASAAAPTPTPAPAPAPVPAPRPVGVQGATGTPSDPGTQTPTRTARQEAEAAAAAARVELPGWDIEPAPLERLENADTEELISMRHASLVGNPALDPTIPPQPGTDGVTLSNRGGDSMEAFRHVSRSLADEIDRENPQLRTVRSGGQSTPPPYTEGETRSRR